MSVQSFVEAVEARFDALHSCVLLRHGETVAEVWWHPYRGDLPHQLFSLSKSFTATAVGLAAAEGRLGLDDPVVKFFPGVPHTSDMRVRHLLTMTTGHATDPTPVATAGDDWATAFLRLPVEHEPGTRFVYNSAATYLLSAIVQRATGDRLLDYLRPRLFEPLGIGPGTWETCPQGVDTGGWGLSLSTADIARFGQLHLQDGVWEGKRLLPEGWVAEATAWQVPNGRVPEPEPDWRQGYGYQFWRCRHDAYRGDGAFGQFCVVAPGRDTVVAITAGVADLQGVLDLVWAHLLDDTSPPAAGVEHRHLPTPRSVAGGTTGTYTVAGPRRSWPSDWRPSHEQPPTIRAIAFAELPGGGGRRVTIEDETGTHVHDCPDGTWHVSRDVDDSEIASSGGWTAPGEFTLRVRYITTPFARTYVYTFDGPAVTIAASDNVSFGPTKYPVVRAVADA
ncbi:hypothetical protein GCM10010399_52550 [Dactylosporangium fulvum]|uniref:Beta-lactamase family protein n=1 Tax=Dactylosporangium fulvum TaxID=53359 RepID=A0ABY5W8K7_9ACTN|nr:serine hydrolase [Dactylosporangium fulvum]UWP86380.1 beta-lactamase family protein [Dactylosporangium fulvum]